MRKINSFDGWFSEFKDVARMYGLIVDTHNKDYYYDYYDAECNPRNAVFEELREFYYAEDEEDWG